MKKADAVGSRQPVRQSGSVVKGGASGPPLGASGFICFNCNETGHKSVNCPRPQRRPRCSSCLKVGHSADQCFKVANDGGTGTTGTSKTTVVLITAGEGENTTQDAVPNEVIDTDEDGMTTCDAIIGRRLKQLKLLVDSGSTVGLMNRSELSNSIRFNSKIGNRTVDITGINQSKVKIEGCLKTKVIVKGKLVLDVSFWVVGNDTMGVSAILGRDFLKQKNPAESRLHSF